MTLALPHRRESALEVAGTADSEPEMLAHGACHGGTVVLRLRVDLYNLCALQSDPSHDTLLVGDEGINSLSQSRRRG